jgi:hypothetical protein
MTNGERFPDNGIHLPAPRRGRATPDWRRPPLSRAPAPVVPNSITQLYGRARFRLLARGPRPHA